MQAIEQSQTKDSEPQSNSGIEFPRYFSKAKIHPFDAISWEKRTALISNERGEIVFEQKDVEVPSSWSQMATNVVVSKYFRGTLDTPSRETSVKQLIARVVETITTWGRADGYFSRDEQASVFRDELTALLVNQFAAFNSPVWFNVGVEEVPQCSACFILSVDDSMESLLDLQKAEGMLFKYGSGAGSNLSNIRSSKEKLSGGGNPSGPVSFMRGFDAWAGTIKSGGKTRRAAKMQILNVDHPDITEFIESKSSEEKKAWALIEQGFNGGFNVPGGAYDSVFFQNSNLSVRVTDEFMQAVIDGEKFPLRSRVTDQIIDYVDARTILQKIAEGTWVCGDPGLQFDTIINDWHTCPESGRINASNPCSEYMHVDNSACNLASINLLKFLDDSDNFDVDKFCHAVDILITAQDILVDRASYPTEKIGKNAHEFRQLGLGFANLGALLMSLGLAYDSEDGRNVAAAIMSVLTGEAYKMSAELAAVLEPFVAYELNAKAMLRVIQKHKKAAEKLPLQLSLDTLSLKAKSVWTETLKQGKLHGFRNSQATVLAPTGTIAFLMDCDTTGIEPDIALVKYKKLIGGGMLKIVNQSVPRALTRLGYSSSEIEDITKFIDAHDCIEGAPHLKEEHLAVFDCAFKPLNGNRSIHHQGHVDMMAATQPFVSGAISKTVNLPESAAVEDIYKTYLDAWKKGLKAIAIYRDNSKRSQPLATAADKETATLHQTAGRERLPDERQSLTHKFHIAGHEGYITVGLYEDGTPGEIFVTMAKEGSTLSGVMDAFATSVSMALQYGVPLTELVRKFAHMRFEPSGMTKNKQIPFAKSIMDYIFRWLAAKFLPVEEQRALGVQVEQAVVNAAPPVANVTQNGSAKKRRVTKSSPMVAFELSDDAPPCTTCGSSLMVRQGACYRCLNCGAQGGCG